MNREAPHVCVLCDQEGKKAIFETLIPIFLVLASRRMCGTFVSYMVVLSVVSR